MHVALGAAAAAAAHAMHFTLAQSSLFLPLPNSNILPEGNVHPHDCVFQALPKARCCCRKTQRPVNTRHESTTRETVPKRVDSNANMLCTSHSLKRFSSFFFLSLVHNIPIQNRSPKTTCLLREGGFAQRCALFARETFVLQCVLHIPPGANGTEGRRLMYLNSFHEKKKQPQHRWMVCNVHACPVGSLVRQGTRLTGNRPEHVATAKQSLSHMIEEAFC